MARVIRYLENGEYKYATVRDIGELERLQTMAKTDIVSAINELFNGGGVSKIPEGLEETLRELEETQATQSQNQIELKQSQEESLLAQQKMIEDLGEVENYLEQVKVELDEDVADVRAKHSALQVEKDLLQEQVIAEKEKLDGIATEMTTKLDSEKYNQDYQSLTDAVSKKAGLEDLANQKAEIISRIDTDIASQQTEIDSAKEGIENLETKTSTLESDIAKNKQDLDAKIVNQTTEISTAKTDIANLKTESGNIKASLGEVEADLDSKYTSQQAEISNAKKDISSLEGKATGLETDIIELSEDMDEKLAIKQSAIDGINTNISGLNTKTSSIEEELLNKANASELRSAKSELEGKITQGLTDLGGRVSNTETRITKNEESINLKANASEVDTKLGTKVDQTVYRDKMSEIDITTEGISQNVTSITGRIDNAEGSITDIESDVSSIDQKADSIQLQVTGIDSTVKEHGTELSSQKSSIEVLESGIELKAEKEEVYTRTETDGKLGAKVDTTTYNQKIASIDLTNEGIKQSVTSLTGRVDNAEGGIQDLESNVSSIDQKADSIQLQVTGIDTNVANQGKTISSHTASIGILEDEISTKVESTDVYKKNDIDTKLGTKVDQTVYQSKISEIVTNADGIKQTVSNQKAEIDEVEGRVTGHDESISTIDQKADSIQLQVNSIDETVGEQGGTLSSHSSSIGLLEEGIKLKAEASNVYTKNEADGKLGSKVDNTTYNKKIAEIDVTTSGITQTVSGLSGRLTTAEGGLSTAKSDISTIKQTQDSIELKVEGIETTVSEQGETISGHSSSIGLLEEEISLKVASTDVYKKNEVDTALGKKVDSTTYNTKMSEIAVTTDGISQKVANQETRLTGLDGKVNSHTSQISSIDQKADEIQLQVTGIDTQVNEQGEQIESHSSSIGLLEDSIVLKAEANKVYTKAETDSKVATSIDSAKAEIKLTTDGISQNVSNATKRIGTAETNISTINSNLSSIDQKADSIQLQVNSIDETIAEQGETISSHGSSIGLLEDSIVLKAEAKNVYTKTEADTKLGGKVDTTTYNTKMSSIDVTTSGISQKVTNQETKLNNVDKTVQGHTSQISTIDQKADSIQLQVSDVSETVTEQGETIASQGASIGLMNDSIKLKAEANNVYTKTEADTKLGSKVDNSTYTKKIAEIDVTTSGITQKVGTVEGKLTTAESGISTLKSDVSTIKQTQSGIALEVEGINTNVTNQGKTISSHSSSITALQDEITSKVEATDVYTKNAVDTKLGQKVESTTYNAKMTEIKQTTDGISQTVSKQATTISGIDGKVQTHTSQISNMSQTVDGITATVSSIEGDLDGVTGRMSSAESKITANSTAINLRATKDDVDKLTGRVASAESEIDVQAGQITQRVTKSDFEESVGVNKWISSRYLITGTDLGAIAPTLSLISGKTASLVKEIADNSTLAIDSGNSQITHLFTNVRLDSAKTISLTVKYNSSLTVLVNGASIYSNKGNGQTAVTVSLSLRTGWNTIEILHGLVSGQTPVLQLGVKLSGQVAKMTTTIGVGNKDETRMTNAETNIKQTQDAIELKAEKTVVDNLGNRVGNAESSLQVHAGQIASKVESSTFNNYTKRVENAESSITQLNKSIALKVDQTDYDTLNQKVTSQGSSITALNTSVNLKANQSVVDTLNQKVTDNTAELEVQAGQISQRVTKTDFDKVSGRVTSAETRITQTEKDITSKANASNVYTKTEADGRITTNVNNAKSEIKQTTDGISQTVSGLSSTVSGHTSSINSHSTSITNMNKAISLKAEASNVYTKTETDGKVNTAVSNAKAEILLTTDRITQKVTAVENSQLSSTDVNNAISNAKSDNFGYRYYKKVIVYGDSIDKYYPVIIKGGNQSVKRDILIQRGYSEQAPSGWNPDMPVHHGGLTVKIKTNFGGWGGANYSWEVHELEEMYSNTFAGATNTGNQTMFAVFLRGGGTTGAVYHIYSDQPLDSNLYSPDPIPASPQIAYNKDLIFKSSDYLAYAPEPRTYTQSVIDEIAKRNFIKLSQNLDTRMSTAETSITQTKSDITLLAKKTDVYTKAEADGKISSSVNSAKAEIKQTTDSISQTVSSINSTVSGHTSSINSHSSSITSMNASINLKANANNVYTKTEADGKISTAITNAKADIKITTDSITSKVSGLESTTGSLGTRMSSAESSITSTKNDITSKVSKTDYTGANVVSMINQTADSVKIMAKNIEFTAGSVVFNALGTDAQSKINTAVNNASSAVSTANSANSTASTASSTASTAKTNADNAVKTANTASTNASNAVSTANTASSNASNAVSTANTANSNANTAKTNASNAVNTANLSVDIAKAMANGKLVHTDPTFRSGINGISIYNNVGDGKVTMSRIAKPSDAPTTSSHLLEIQSTGAVQPNFGGIISSIQSRANAKFVVRYIAKLPKGYLFAPASNAMGDGYKDRFLGSVDGTGAYEEYIRVVECGSTGTFSSGGHLSVGGSPIPTPNAPLKWYLANCSIYDITDADYTAIDAYDKATNAMNAITDMSSDDKLTPIEKQQLKKEWASISAEKPQYESLATTYGISTEKTYFVNAYNSLNTKLNGSGGYLLNLTTTTNLGSGGGATFRATFDDYYDKKAQLIKKINETSRSLANEAKNTAGTANTNASNAVSTANTAKSDASTAKTNASNAVTTANTANSNATTAKSDASTAKSNASSAVSTANTANSNATNAINRVSSVEGKINNAVTTIDNTGVTVRNGNFFLEDDNTTTKYNVAMLRNLVKDHSFEILKGNPSAYNADSVKYNWLDVDKKSYNSFQSPWFFSGTPKVAMQYSPDTAKALPIFGNQGAVVGMQNFVRQIIDGIAPNTTYTLSAYFKRQWNVAVGATPKLEAWRVHADGSRNGYIKIQSFPAVPSDYTTKRYAMTFTTPANMAVDEAIEIVLLSESNYWVQVDGVQLVEGNAPCLYNPEDTVWDVVNGVAPVWNKDRILWSGGSFMHGGQTIYPDIDIMDCPNGWILCWSDYNAGEGGVNYDFVYSHIPKFHASSFNGKSILVNVSAGGNTLDSSSMTSKVVLISNDRITGHDINDQGAYMKDIVLRHVIMY